MNAVTTRAAGAIASLSSLKQGLQNVAAHIPATNTDPFMRMEKDGNWVYGADNIEVEDGSIWAVNPLSLKHGYSCWTNYDAALKKKNDKLGEVMVSMNAPKPDRSTLQDFDPWKWSDQLSFQLICTNGADKGEQALYSTTSVGGMNVVAKLVNAIMEQLDKDPEHPVPLIELESDSYNHKQYGKTFVPVFNIKGWTELSDELPDMDDAEVEDVAETVVETKAVEAPARKRKAAETKATPAKEEPKPADAPVDGTKAVSKADLLRAQLAALEAEEAEGADEPTEEPAASKPEPQTSAAGGEVRRRRRVA